MSFFFRKEAYAPDKSWFKNQQLFHFVPECWMKDALSFIKSRIKSTMKCYWKVETITFPKYLERFFEKCLFSLHWISSNHPGLWVIWTRAKTTINVTKKFLTELKKQHFMNVPFLKGHEYMKKIVKKNRTKNDCVWHLWKCTSKRHNSTAPNNEHTQKRNDAQVPTSKHDIRFICFGRSTKHKYFNDNKNTKLNNDCWEKKTEQFRCFVWFNRKNHCYTKGRRKKVVLFAFLVLLIRFVSVTNRSFLRC